MAHRAKSISIKLEKRLNGVFEDEVETVLDEYKDDRITYDEMGRDIALINHVRRGAVKLCTNKIRKEDGDR